MRTAVSSKGAGLGAWIHPEFRTCNFIVVVDEQGGFSVIENKTGKETNEDEKVLTGQLAGKEISLLITGDISTESVLYLRSIGIDVLKARQGSILELVEKGNSGNLPSQK